MKKVFLGCVIVSVMLVGYSKMDYPKETLENKYFQVCKDEYTKKYGDSFTNSALDTRNYYLNACFKQKENEAKKKNK